jgi:hypothetical protein
MANTASVTNYKDNPDGTTTNYLSDGSQSVVRYNQLSDGSLQPYEVSARPNSSQVIDGSKLGTQPVATVPQPVRSNTAQNSLGATVGSVANSAETNFSLSDPANAIAVKEDPKKGLLDRISNIIGLQSKQGEKTLQYQKDEQVFQKKDASRKLENDIISKTRAYDKQIEKIRQNSEGKFGGAVEQDVANLERQKNSELADLAIQYKVANGAYTDAVAIVDAKVKAEFEPLQNEIQSLSNLYNLYSNDMTESEKMQAQAQINEKQAQLDYQRQLARDQILQKYDLNKIAYQHSFDTNPGGDVTVQPIINPTTGKADPTSQLTSIISQGKIKDNANLQNVVGVISAIQGFAQNNPDGKFAGLGLVRPGKFTLGPTGTANQSAIEAINLKVQQWASGAALTEAQTKQVEKITPRVGDTDKQVRQKTNALTNFMMTQARSSLATQGINYNPESIDFFKPVISEKDINAMDSILSQ